MMRKSFGLGKLCAACLVVVFMVTCSWAAEQHVVAYLVGKIGVYEQRGNSFKRVGKMTAEELPELPVPVLEACSKGFVKVETAKGTFWLDTMDVDVQPPKSSGASKKKHSLSSSMQKKGFYSRGIGD